MNSFAKALYRHSGYLRKYPYTVSLLAICCAIILISSYQQHTFIHALAYVFGIWFCCFLTDIVIYTFPVSIKGFPVKRPVRAELATIIICTAIGAVFLCIRFFSDWQRMPGIVKLSFMPLILFTFPIVLALIYLFGYKYKPRELGITFNYWYLPLILHIIVGGLTLLFAPEASHWHQAMKEFGFWGLLFTGIISAALPEEFTRMLLQTRIGKACNSIAFGMFMATLIWAAMHIPVGYSQHFGTFTCWQAIEGVIYLVPVGIFWGYLTQRTGSLLPAIGMHGFNLWGLQNF